MKEPRFMLAGLSGFIVYFCWTALEPILAPRLNDLNHSSLEIGVIFFVGPLFYFLAGIGV